VAEDRPADRVARGLRAARAEDAALIAGWLNEPAIRRYLSSNLRGGAMTAGLIRAALRRPDQAWYLFLDEADDPLGIIAFDTVDTTDKVANLWFALGRSERAGRGDTSGAITRLLGANPLGLHAATAWVGEPNIASARCLEKAGFQIVGRSRRAFAVEGVHDRILYDYVWAAP
jgi:RimJ/RimL family protein N-acetyltransferase